MNDVKVGDRVRYVNSKKQYQGETFIVEKIFTESGEIQINGHIVEREHVELVNQVINEALKLPEVKKHLRSDI